MKYYFNTCGKGTGVYLGLGVCTMGQLGGKVEFRIMAWHKAEFGTPPLSQSIAHQRQNAFL